MADEEDVDAAFRRLVEDIESEHDSARAKPSRESMREVKREARARKKGARPSRSSRERLRTVLVLTTTVAILGGLAYVQLHRGGGLLPGDAASAAAPTDSGPTPTPTPSDGTDTGLGYPTAGHEEAPAPLGTPPAARDAPGRYRFMFTQSDGTTPVAYDPCRPLHYVVNTASEPAQGKALLSAALATISSATGLHFVDDGTTTETDSRDREAYQPQRYGDRWVPVLVVWPSGRQQPDFVGNTIGEAGSEYLRSETGVKVYVTGEAQFDSDWFTEVLAQPGGTTRAESVMLHEFGHLLGLDHVADRSQIMYAMETPTARHYGAGDLAGLAKLGAGACAPTL